MKKITNFLFAVDIDGMSLDKVESILFKFQQGTRSKSFSYPSDNAFRVDDLDRIALRWMIDDTLLFDSNRRIEMDTFIRVLGSDENPHTEILAFEMSRSLFTPEEVSADG